MRKRSRGSGRIAWNGEFRFWVGQKAQSSPIRPIGTYYAADPNDRSNIVVANLGKGYLMGRMELSMLSSLTTHVSRMKRYSGEGKMDRSIAEVGFALKRPNCKSR